MSGITTMKKKNNFLTLAQQEKVIIEIRKNLSKFTQERATRKEASSFISQVCGFPVTEHNLGYIVDELNIKWEGRQGHKPKVKPTNIELAESVAELYKSLGLPLPKCLENLPK